ncbi:MAG TPA: ABC transporter permease subunit [Nitrososphaerales archaeon]|nr:ABC transporter permease subunit [Nitrososphaerales archaeon]
MQAKSPRIWAGLPASSITILFIVLAIIFWQFALHSSTFVALPSQVMATMPAMWVTYLSSLAYTLPEYFAALALSLLIGVPLGFLIAWRESTYRSLNPLLGLALVTPKMAFIPIITIWLGISTNISAIALGTLLGVFPIIVNTIAGVRSTKPEYLLLARSVGLSSPQVYRKILLPSFYPSLLVGIFLGSNLCMTGVLLMEMILEHPGVGYLIEYYSNEYQTSSLYAAAVLTIVITLAISGTLWLLSKHFEKRNLS